MADANIEVGETTMNILQAFIYFNNKMTLVISGLPGSGKLKAGKMLSEELGVSLLKQKDYIKHGFTNMKTLSNGKVVNDFNTDNAIDWDKLNKDIKDKQGNGVIIVGMSFPQDKLKKHLHINLNLSKTKYLSNVNLSQEEKLMFDELIYPYYGEAVKNAKINKFINVNDLDEEQLYDAVWNTFIDIITNYIKWFEENRMADWIKEKEQKAKVERARQIMEYSAKLGNIRENHQEAGSGFKSEDDGDDSESSSSIEDGQVMFANPYLNPNYNPQMHPYIMLPQFSRF